MGRFRMKLKLDRARKFIEAYCLAIPVEEAKEIEGIGICSHPLSSFRQIVTNNGFEDFNNETLKTLWDSYFKKRFEDADSILTMLTHIRKPYRLDVLYYIRDFLDQREYDHALNYCWMSTEFPMQNDFNHLIELFESSSQGVMTDEEKDIFDRLPNTITVYRGLQEPDAKIQGLSWTTSRKQAEWFANRFKYGKVYKAKINKVYVFAYFKYEDEIVLDPSKLKNVAEIRLYRNVDYVPPN
jgi:hypothetical protein